MSKIKKMTSKNPKPQNTSDFTSQLSEGSDLSFEIRNWKDTATSECRLEMIRELVSLNLGFNEVEDYDNK